MNKMRAILFSTWFLFSILAAPFLFAQEETNVSGELEDYITNIREWRMTESARMSLRSLAGILTENTVLSFSKDEASGTYWKSYRGTSCPNPNMDPVEREKMKAEYELLVAPILLKLHPLADRDNSGFVTGEEGAQFRDLVEFAYQASYVAGQEGKDNEQFYIGMNMDRERFKRRVAEYDSVFSKARASGIDLPELSF